MLTINLFKFALFNKIMALGLCVMLTVPAQASFIKQKQRFEIDNFTFFNGQSIPKVSIGWEAYGQLNADKSNAILITHYFTGSSHAAGQYVEDGELGYWDAIIGPGKAIDTEHYYVIAIDSLANMNTGDPNVHTTGPASINPATNKPYGLTFPVITMRDLVNSQKAVIDALGIKQLHAVVGASMGSMQAIEWATAYPNKVKKLISVIGSAQADAWTSSALELWTLPIKLDANWNNGNYYDGDAPTGGLTAALMAITHTALHPAFFDTMATELNYSPLESAPLNDIHASHSIIKWLKARAEERAEDMDANHLLYLVRANQLFIAGQQKTLEQGLNNLTADTLLLPATGDLLLMPYHLERLHEKLQTANKSSALHYIEGNFGHLDGIYSIGSHSDTISRFLRD